MEKIKKHDCIRNPLGTVEPPCANTSRKRPPIQNTKNFPLEALQMELLVNDQLL